MKTKKAEEDLHQIQDVVGIGAGPFNLSVAALLYPLKNIKHIFLEKQERFFWHPGMLLPDTTVQNSFLKDLVSFADPTSRFSFLAFLHEKKRLYEYVNAGFTRTSRREFNLYLQWVAQSLSAIKFGQNVREVRRHPQGFEIHTQESLYVAKNVVIATGPSPAIPVMAAELLGNDIFHSSNYLFKRDGLLGRRVGVIGGGQSGAEIVLDLLGQANPPHEILWLSARPSLAPLDESHFANEWFTPAYVEYFWGLGGQKKKELLSQHTLASDGISPETIEAIYQKLYNLRFLEQGSLCRLMHSRLVISMKRSEKAYDLELVHIDTDRHEFVNVDCVVLATGYIQNAIPSVIEGLSEDIEFFEANPVVNLDFSLKYEGAGKIYVLNGSKHSHGISEPNLSVNAWRAATIINSILEREVYPSPQDKSILELSNEVRFEAIA